MQTTKKLLTISLAVSLMLCSISLFIFSLRSITANAQTPEMAQGNYVVAGIVSAGINRYEILGYNVVKGDVKVLAKYKQ